jgi:GT2 family glycosyltransferase
MRYSPPDEVSVIVSVYKDVETLAIVLKGLSRQSVQGFEIVVSEDGEDPSVSAFLQSVELPVAHVHGPDVGWTKNVALNRAVRRAKGRYLIFLDGDCIPHSRFVETHMRLAEPGKSVSGRRVDIGPGYARRIRDGQIALADLERPGWYVAHYAGLIRDQARALEDGFHVRPGGWLHRHVLPRVSRIRGLLGCNFACWKADLLKINGFDEDYDSPAVGEDTDLEWRFEHIGVTLKSARNMAIVYHFRHPLRFSGFAGNMAKMRQKMASGRYFCERGITSDPSARPDQ